VVGVMTKQDGGPLMSHPEDVGIEMLRNYCLFFVGICRKGDVGVRIYSDDACIYALTHATCRSMVW
jgi:hypothetical protein